MLLFFFTVTSFGTDTVVLFVMMWAKKQDIVSKDVYYSLFKNPISYQK